QYPHPSKVPKNPSPHGSPQPEHTPPRAEHFFAPAEPPLPEPAGPPELLELPEPASAEPPRTARDAPEPSALASGESVALVPGGSATEPPQPEDETAHARCTAAPARTRHTSVFRARGIGVSIVRTLLGTSNEPWVPRNDRYTPTCLVVGCAHPLGCGRPRRP